MFSLDENGYDIQYQYDPLGNRLVKSADGGLTTSTYDIANQLQTSEDCDGVTTYTFDPAGNQHLVEAPSGALTTNTWDDENRRVLVELPSGQRVTSAYNAGGLRIRKESSAGDTKFIWDQQNYLQETDENDATQVAYTNKPAEYGELVSQYRWTGAIWVAETYHFDALGSTTELTDENEDVVESYRYDAFGNKKSANDYTPAFTYVGKLGYYSDGFVNDYYIRARSFRPAIARWTSMDPIRLSSVAANLYSYVENRVMFQADPSGLQAAAQGKCGPDVTSELIRIHDKIDLQFDMIPFWDFSTHFSRCRHTIDTAGWEINNIRTASNAIAGIPTLPACQQTVTVTSSFPFGLFFSAKCYKAASVNYFLYGVVASNCTGGCPEFPWAWTVQAHNVWAYEHFNWGDHAFFVAGTGRRNMWSNFAYAEVPSTICTPQPGIGPDEPLEGYYGGGTLSSTTSF